MEPDVDGEPTLFDWQPPPLPQVMRLDSLIGVVVAGIVACPGCGRTTGVLQESKTRQMFVRCTCGIFVRHLRKTEVFQIIRERRAMRHRRVLQGGDAS
jgi:hypothetical protein